jgi:Icc-related predicted phosphoesterase
MKLLLFSDLHCGLPAAHRMVELARGVDIAIGAGDFGQVRRKVGVCIDILRDLPCPAVVVPGNNESLEELRTACSDWAGVHVLHGSGVEIDGVHFFGLGGGVPTTPFGSWSWDFSEAQAAELLNGFQAGGVLVSHSPPKGCLDVDSGGDSRGSEAVRDVIRSKHPALIVCGHIHACGGKTATFHGTTIVNAGPGGVVIELPE